MLSWTLSHSQELKLWSLMIGPMLRLCAVWEAFYLFIWGKSWHTTIFPLYAVWPAVVLHWRKKFYSIKIFLCISDSLLSTLCPVWLSFRSLAFSFTYASYFTIGRLIRTSTARAGWNRSGLYALNPAHSTLIITSISNNNTLTGSCSQSDTYRKPALEGTLCNPLCKLLFLFLHFEWFC